MYESIAQARRQYHSDTLEVARMERDLMGCDWCCGGGTERRSWLLAAAERARCWLRARGVTVEPLRVCKVCAHGEPTDNGLCSRCCAVPNLRGD